MDPINIIIGLNIIATFGANLSGAKKGLKSTVSAAKEKPKTYLQSLPLFLSTLTLVVLIAAVFNLGTLAYTEQLNSYRMTGLIIYLFFSWFQIWAYKSLGANYSQEILILKNHQLVTKGAYSLIRHPQYLAQIFVDLAGGLAVLSYILIPLAIIEIPILVMRASLEDKLLAKNFKDSFKNYKMKSGFMIPFIG